MGILKGMGKATWYRTIFLCLLLTPALICQTVVPIIPIATWDAMTEPLYAFLLRFQAPDELEKGRPVGGPGEREGKVAVIVAGPETRKVYGWPVDRQLYIKLLNELKDAGNPWILSLLNFQDITKPQGSKANKQDSKTRKEHQALDQWWVDTLKAYNRYIGSPIKMQAPADGEEVSRVQEEKLFPRLLISKNGSLPSPLPFMPVSLQESDDYILAQRAFGVEPGYGTESTIYCMQPYYGDSDEVYVLPTSLVWAFAHAGRSRISTPKRAEWPRPKEKIAFTFDSHMHLAPRHCLSSPGLTTRAFAEKRDILTIEMADIIEDRLTDAKGRKASLKQLLQNRTVILASDGRRFRGAGLTSDKDDGIVYEYELTARFLDDLLSHSTIRRFPLEDYGIFSWLPLALALVIVVPSFILTLPQMLLLSFLLLSLLLGFSFMQLVVNATYLIPMQAIAYMMISTMGCFALFLYLYYYGSRRLLTFSRRLRAILSQANTLDEIRQGTMHVGNREFNSFKVGFSGYDLEMYEAASNPQAAAMYIKKVTANEPDLNKALTAHSRDRSEKAPLQNSIITNIRSLPKKEKRRVGERGIHAKLAVSVNHRRLGSIDLGLSFQPYEESFIGDLVSALQLEVTQAWNRIELLAKQKLKDYDLLLQTTRSTIMSQFLPQSLVNQFRDDQNMEANFQKILVPRPTRVALVQADIRGYSNLTATRSPIEVVTLLQSYYKNVVDAAQQIAQVKLIGDCIFLFIEEKNAVKDEVSVSDLALHIAGLLVRETEKQNRLRPADPAINFGIAIHFGDVIAGNLSSETCIDYTVVGPNVNMVARVEEMTKSDKIKDIIGVNAILMTEEARRNLRLFSHLAIKDCKLSEIGVKVRSFTDISKLYYVTKDEAIDIAQMSTLKRLSNPKIPLAPLVMPPPKP